MRAFLLALTFVLAATPADAGRRHAIVIGANVGGPSHEPLRYAETDAARVAAVLRNVAGFAPGDVVLLTQADAAAVRLALIELNARIREESGPTMLFVYYSGHGDARSLHLYGTQLDLAELRNLVASSPARTRVLIVDSCQSGAITRVKGGTPAPEFDVVQLAFDEFELRIQKPDKVLGIGVHLLIYTDRALRDCAPFPDLDAGFHLILPDECEMVYYDQRTVEIFLHPPEDRFALVPVSPIDEPECPPI